MRDRLRRLYLALCLAVVALLANGFEEQQLSANVFAALHEDASTAGGAFHVMPDGRIMAGHMDGAHNVPDAGGHTHKGHADCDTCGAVAGMAAFTLPSLPVVIVPPAIATPFALAPPTGLRRATLHPAYASRAPPARLI